MIIYLDYDGTMVEHMWPLDGPPTPHSVEVCLKLQEKNYKFILNTKRVELDRPALQRSLDYLWKSGLKISTVRAIKIEPTFWNIHENMEILFLDDLASGIPLMKSTVAIPPMVDWRKVEKELKKIGRAHV